VKLGDLVKAKETSVTGYIIEERYFHNGFTTVGESEDFSVHPDYQQQYLVRWFQPPEGMQLTTMQSWRAADKLELLSEAK
jgi:hypothetical protein